MMYIYHHDRGTYDRLVRGEYRMFDEEFRAVQVLVSSRVGRQGKSPGEGGGSGKDPQETQQAWLSELRKKAGVDPAKHVNKSRSSLYLAALNMHPRLRLIAKREKRFSASRMGYNSYLELGLALMGGPKKNYLKREEFLYHNDRAAFDRVMKGVSSVEQEYLSCKREMARNKNPGGTEQPAAPRQDRVSPRRDGSRGMDQALLFNMELESKANSLVKRVDWDMVLCSCSTAELASMEKTNRAIVGMVRKVGRILRASLKERAEQQQQQQQQQ